MNKILLNTLLTLAFCASSFTAGARNGRLDASLWLPPTPGSSELVANGDSAYWSSVTEGSDVTDILVNPSFETGDFTGWTYVAGKLGDHNVECYQQVVDIFQEVEGVKDGIYSISVQAFERPSMNGTFDGSEKSKVYLYMNEFQTPVQNIVTDLVRMEDATEANSYVGNGGGYWPYDALFSNGAVEGWIPNSVTGARIAFDAGRYVQKCYGLVEGGKMKIGLTSNGIVAHWVLWADFKLTYEGKSYEALASILPIYTDKLADMIDANEDNMTQDVIDEANVVLDEANQSFDDADVDAMYSSLINVNNMIGEIDRNVDVVMSYLKFYDSFQLTAEEYLETAQDFAVEMYDDVNSRCDDYTSLSAKELEVLVADMKQTIAALKVPNDLSTASELNPYDITSLIENPDFNDSSVFTDDSAWKSSYNLMGNHNMRVAPSYYEANNACLDQFIEVWCDETLGSGEIYQVLQYLPKGKYVLEADVIATDQLNSLQNEAGALLFMESGESRNGTVLSTGNNSPQHYSTTFIKEDDDAVLRIGLRTEDDTNVNWLAADNFTLTYYGLSELGYYADLENSIDSLRNYLGEYGPDGLNKMSANTYADAQGVLEDAGTLTAEDSNDDIIAMNETVNSALQACIANVSTENIVAMGLELDKEYYLYNEEADRFLIGSNEWGSRASLGRDPIPVKIELSNYGGDVLYTDTYLLVDSVARLAQGWRYISSVPDLWVDYRDHSNGRWNITRNEDDGSYNIQFADVNDYARYAGFYLSGTGSDDDTRIYLTQNAAHWRFMTKEEYEVYRKNPKGWELASDENPVDFTEAITNSDYMGTVEGWLGTQLYPGSRNGTGVFDNAEHYNKTYDTYQTINGLPAGIYRVNLRAFYRSGSPSNDADVYFHPEKYDADLYQLAKFYAVGNGNDSELPIRLASSDASYEVFNGSTNIIDRIGTTCYVPYNMQAANIAYEAGRYENGMYVEVGEDGLLTIGVRKNAMVSADWTDLDGWELWYYGKSSSHYAGEDAMTDVYYADLSAKLAKLNQACNDAESSGTVMADLLAEACGFAADVAAEMSSTTLSELQCRIYGFTADDYVISLGSSIGVVTIELALAGTLSNELSALGLVTSNIESLKVTGPINNNDLSVISDMPNLKNLDLQEAYGVTEITSSYMYNNDVIQTVKLPSSVNTIYGNAFYYCNSLKSVTLPDHLYSLGYDVFADCYNLEEIVSHSVMPPHTYYNGRAMYNGNKNMTLRVPANANGRYASTTAWGWIANIEEDFDDVCDEAVVHDESTFFITNKMNETKVPSVVIRSTHSANDFNGNDRYGALNLYAETETAIPHFEMSYDRSYEYNTNRTYFYDGINGNSYYRGYRPRFTSSLISDGSVTAQDAYVDVYTCSNIWMFFTPPFDVKVSSVGKIYDGDCSWVVRTYDGAARATSGTTGANWKQLGADDVMVAGQGYILRNDVRRLTDGSTQNWTGLRFPAELDNAQLIFSGDDRSLALTDYAAANDEDANWNFVGNPYPAFYDTRFLNVDAPITVYNMWSNNYEAFSPVDDVCILRPGEAFFVQSNGASTINFPADGRQHGFVPREVYEAPARNASISRSIINLTISSGEETLDRTRIVFNDEAEMGYDKCDAAKFAGEGKAQIYTVASNVKYAINERPFQQGYVRIGTQVNESGEYQIALTDIKNFNQHLFIEDKLTGTVTEITEDAPYSFYAEAGMSYGRFFLHAADDATAIRQVGADSDSESDAIYTLQGVKLNQTAGKGIYIIGNKKVIVK